MICPQCGTENADHASFCGKCGRELEVAPAQPEQQAAPAQPVQRTRPDKLVRCSDDKQIGGVSSGIARYFGLDVGLVRLLMILGLIFGTATFWIYIVLWAVLPEQQCGSQ